MVKSSLIPHPEFGFLQYKPTPSPEEITDFYAKEFYSGDYKNFNNSALEVQLQDREFHEGSWSDMAYHIETLSGKKLCELSVLDVGCGWAQALLFLAQKGMDCYGFDPAPEAVDYARSKGLNVVRAGMDGMKVFGDKKFDVVILKNVLEHLSDPVQVMREIAQEVLIPGGILVVDVPNEFNLFQVSGQKIHDLDEWWVAPPAHLNYFSNETLSCLLTGTGYEVCLSQASFPLEMFLLFGDCYVGNPALGKECHSKRVAFELNLRRLGRESELRQFYTSLAALNLGRQVTAYARAI